MSYWFHLSVSTGGDEEVDAIDPFNATSNVSPIWTDALGRRIRELNGMPAPEAEPILDEGVRRMEAEPERYAAMNPSNGWGDSGGALEVLRRLRDGCREHPAAVVRMSY